MGKLTKEMKELYYQCFETLKDNWEDNSEGLTNAIIQVSKFNINDALEMWSYLLKHHYNKLEPYKTFDLTYKIYDDFSEDTYELIAKNKTIPRFLFQKYIYPEDYYRLIIYFCSKGNYKTINKFLSFVQNNKNDSITNSYEECKSSNLASCLNKVLNNVYDLDDKAIQFFSSWIELIKNKTEQMKLKVLMYSREADKEDIDEEDNNKTELEENTYLVTKNLSIDDTELAFNNREIFEIKKIIEYICSNKIKNIDFSKLDLYELTNIYKDIEHFNNNSFNIIGAYYILQSLPNVNRHILEYKYLENLSTDEIIVRTCWGESEFSIKQSLSSSSTFLTNNIHVWNYDYLFNYCKKIYDLYPTFNKHTKSIKKKRHEELSEYANMSVNKLSLPTRIKNSLERNNITNIQNLIYYIEFGKAIEGIGVNGNMKM